MDGEAGAEMRADCVRDGLPDGALANVFDVVDHVVEHSVGLPAEVVPVGWIEGYRTGE